MSSSRLKFILKNEAFITGLSLFLLTCYYLLFLNKGLVLSDEGYYAHIAERILQGQVPYRDFDLQYPPGYFYLLALFYKAFGLSILTGRVLNLGMCLGIAVASLYLLRAFGLNSTKAKVIAIISIASFGYPLINIPVVVWPTVLITELVMLWLLKWFQTNNRKHLFFIGLWLGLLVLLKQNIALTEIVVVNLLLIFEARKNLMKAAITVCIVNTTWIVPTVVWVYVFFLRNNLTALFEFIAFNKRYLSVWPFSYPPLTFLLHPLGFFKLLPYYLPILFIPILSIVTLRKHADKKLLVLFLPLVGFFTTIYPTSDLIHVYPYYGLILVSLLIFAASHLLRFQKVFYVLIFLSIVSGFYLTLFREYYRYQAPYRFQNTQLQLPRTQGIFVDTSMAQNIGFLSNFINSHTNKHDPVFVYSFAPMLYFILERPNPTKYLIYYAGYLTPAEERATIHTLEEKKVTYIIDDGFDAATTPLSTWIKKQKKVTQMGNFTILMVRQ